MPSGGLRSGPERPPAPGSIRAFDQGRILRTHVLRPTWHFVSPADIRWLLALTAPRVHAANAYYYRKLELDEVVFRRSRAALLGALRGGAALTREEVAAVHRKAGIDAAGLRLAYLVMRAELDGVLCSGPLRGKQFTYALLEERVPAARVRDRQESLAELTRRYFAGHGPALVKDFAWWSGLTTTEARSGLEMAKGSLLSETVSGKTYWFAEKAKTPAPKTPAVRLLPNYDEYLIGYKDHSASFEPSLREKVGRDTAALQAHIVVLDGHVIGGWRRTIQKKEITITTDLLVRLDKAQRAAVAAAAERYGAFMEMPVGGR